jgi:hypothetical protein
LAQLVLRAIGKAPRGREDVHDVIVRRGESVLWRIDIVRHWTDSQGRARDPETFAQRLRDLPDMRDLFHRRANERRQAFPFRLPNDA